MFDLNGLPSSLHVYCDLVYICVHVLTSLEEKPSNGVHTQYFLTSLFCFSNSWLNSWPLMSPAVLKGGCSGLENDRVNWGTKRNTQEMHRNEAIPVQVH